MGNGDVSAKLKHQLADFRWNISISHGFPMVFHLLEAPPRLPAPRGHRRRRIRQRFPRPGSTPEGKILGKILKDKGKCEECGERYGGKLWERIRGNLEKVEKNVRRNMGNKQWLLIKNCGNIWKTLGKTGDEWKQTTIVVRTLWKHMKNFGKKWGCPWMKMLQKSIKIWKR